MIRLVDLDPTDPAQGALLEDWVEVHNAAGRAVWGPLALKVANLSALQAAVPHVTTLRTWNADTNAPMLAVNRRMGFEPSGVTREWLKDLA